MIACRGPDKPARPAALPRLDSVDSAQEPGFDDIAMVSRDLDRLWTLTHDRMLVCDPEGRVIEGNPAWREVFGAARARRQ